MMRLLPALAAAWFAVPGLTASAASGDIDLGIPTFAPWEDPALTEEGRAGRAAKQKAAAHPLELRVAAGLRQDLDSVARWRAGLLGVVEFAKRRPQVFPPLAAARDALFEEYREEARGAWVRAMDFWLALDGFMGRYAAFGALRDPGLQDEAFLTAYAAFLAEARFAREWTELASRDEQLEKLFDEPVGELGLPAGAYGRLKARFRAPAFAAAAAAAAARRRAIRKGKVPGEGSGDPAFLPKHPKFRGSLPEASRIARDEAFRPLFRTLSAADPMPDSVALVDRDPLPLVPPSPAGVDVSVSSQVVYALDTVRYWLQLDPPGEPRPEVLITSSQAAQVALALVPGDILLLRRERFLDGIGLPGYWHHAGLYVGTETERRRAFGGDFLNEHLRASFPEAYRRHSEGAPRGVAEAGESGRVGFSPWGGFARADGLAVLRPRLEADAAAEAMVRVFARAQDGRPVVSGAELIALAYPAAAGRRGLSIPATEFAGVRSVWPDQLVKAFDANYGTQGQELDLVRFLDPHEERQETREASLEEFRRSWRRPKWFLEKEKPNETQPTSP
ncbi:MAG: hypothetical protein A2X36_12630 [Elusimicrobia bacterium GWA2_69_24]|nr:MAG: hypothetical protein A2X36_12630 [Elusimicrobia bacterium GWA2_69_24]